MNNTSTFDHPNILPGVPAILRRTDTGPFKNGPAEEEFWRCAAAPAWHPVRPGERVTVYRVPLLSRPFIEGRATVLKPIAHMRDLYRVQFENERRSHRRLVHPGDWQSDPDRLLAALTGHWHASINPDLFVDF